MSKAVVVRPPWFSRTLASVATIAVAGVAGLYGLAHLRSNAEREVYRDRLVELSGQYDELLGMYNSAVRRTAVTELVVAEGRLSVRVRNAEGTIEEIETPFDPSREVYVDYAVLGGRVWIRRVFDSATRPEDALVLDPKLATIDWDPAGIEVGKAVYRSLGEGRWVVGVTGNGSLGLVKSPEGAEPAELGPPPAVADFAEVERKAKGAVAEVGLGDLLREVVGD